MPSLLIAAAGLSGVLAVILGAFGAHALKARLAAELLAVWQTAVQYHFYHTLALLAAALLAHHRPSVLLSASGFAFLLGLILFSGSLYWLALGGPRWLGPVTPLGGVAFMIGWALLAVTALSK